MITNPILPGFNPDPSLIRVEDDFYLVTSSFEWFPGIPLYHSKDLKHWRLVDYLLKTKAQIDLTGVMASRGVWAPGLSYCAVKKRFYLVYSNVHSQNKWLFDVDNYMIWADDPLGPWSEPVYINSSGFDPSVFHDDDGSMWILNKDRDFRPANIDKRAIVIQPFDPDKKALAGSPSVISRGATRRCFVEGAHLFKKDGWYYLLTAEGGTGYGHCVALARSRAVTGPYEACPHNPVITSTAQDFTGTEQLPFMMLDRYNPAAQLQKAGHGSLVSTPNGEWYMAHLCARPLMPQQRCMLGRETALQQMEWTEDGWLRMADGSNIAKLEVPAPKLPAHPFPPEDPQSDFDDDTLPLCFCTPRNEITPGWADLTGHRGYLRLRGQESMSSNYKVSLIARRLTSFRAQATTLLHFTPEHYHHLAGISCYYDNESHFVAYKTFDETSGQAILSGYAFIHKQMEEFGVAVPVPMEAPVWLRAGMDNGVLQFQYSLDGAQYQPLGPPQDMTWLSDEGSECGCFTGTFVGMFAQDTHTKSKWAEFDWFRYEAYS